MILIESPIITIEGGNKMQLAPLIKCCACKQYKPVMYGFEGDDPDHLMCEQCYRALVNYIQSIPKTSKVSNE